VRGGRNGDDAGELARERRFALGAIVATVTLADLILLDQLWVTMHLFTLGVVGLAFLVFLRPPRRRPATGSVSRPART
jgi:hypothetical protein